MFSLKNKKAVVTGGGSGIGKAIATILAKQGAEVHIIELGTEHAQDTIDEIKTNGGTAFSYGCDVSDPSSCSRCF
jgi:2-keto-3-deoxy-L-fuconate dehydrogenase